MLFIKRITYLSTGETMVKGINEIIDEIRELHKEYELYIEAGSVLSWLANHNHHSTRIWYDEHKQTLMSRRVSLTCFEDKTSAKCIVEEKSRFNPLDNPITYASLIAAACFAYSHVIEEIRATKRDKTGRYAKNQRGEKIWSGNWEEIWCAQSAIEKLVDVKSIPREETYRSLSGIYKIYSSMLLDDLTQKLEANDFKTDRFFYLAT